VAHEDDVLHVESIEHGCHIIGEGVEIVSATWLVGSPVPAPIVRHAAPGVGAAEACVAPPTRPPVTTDTTDFNAGRLFMTQESALWSRVGNYLRCHVHPRHNQVDVTLRELRIETDVSLKVAIGFTKMRTHRKQTHLLASRVWRKMPPDLVEHLERHLGPVDAGWKPSGGADCGIQVAAFPAQPYDGVTTYVTLGLSRSPLPMTMTGDRQVRQELVFIADDGYPREQVASFLFTFADYIRGQRRALLRGDVVGPGPPLIPGVGCNAVYAAIPVLHDDGLATYSGSQPPTVFVWIVPVHGVEAALVRTEGWERFEGLLERRNPDFGDLDRLPVV
jgi:hypothetical protein